MSKKTEVAAAAPSAMPVLYADVTTPETFEEASQAIVKINKSIKQHSVLGYWLIGKMVHDMQEDEGKYGQGITARVSKDLEAQGESMCKRTIEECHKAYNRCPSMEDIREMVDTGLGWSQLKSINTIGRKADRIKAAKHVMSSEPTPMNARRTQKYVQEVMDKKDKKKGASNVPTLPEGHPSGFFNKVLENVRKVEGAIDRSEKILMDTSTTLSDLTKHFEANIAGLGDEGIVSDAQFEIAVNACKEIAEISGMLQDRLKLSQQQQSDLFSGISNILKQRYSALTNEVYFGEE